MTAIEDFLSMNRNNLDIIHNSQIIMDRLEEIEGISRNPIDVAIRRIRRQSLKRYPFVDSFIDFASISILETILRIFDRRVNAVVEGRENIPSAPVIFASNHETETEHLYLARACCSLRDLNYFKFLQFLNLKGIANKSEVPIFFAKYQLFNIPLVGSILASTAFPVERELRDAKSMEIGSLFLQRGSNIMIYPEGTRNVEKQVKAKSGVVRLAIQNKVPVVPIGQVGLHDLTKGSFMPKKKGTWVCTFGKPITYEQYYDREVSYSELRDLTEELMEKIEELKAHGLIRMMEIEEAQRAALIGKSINEIVVNKFEKLEKKPNNPFDFLYRKFVNFYSKLPIIGDYADAFTHSLIRLGMDLLVNPLTFNIKITGRENLIKAKPAILCSNHESFLDIGIYGLKLVPNELLNYYGYLFPSPRNDVNEKIWFMMKRELAQFPIISSWTLSAGGFPIARGEKDKDAIFISKELLKNNRNVVVFPQQTTYPTIDVDSGKTGAIRLAIETGRPIIPLSIKGSHNAMHTGIWNLLVPPKGYPIEINIGEPIYYGKYQGQDLSYDDYKKMTRELMVKIKDLQDGKITPHFNPNYDGEASKPLIAKMLERAGSLLRLPRVDLQKDTKENFISKALNQITDFLGITSTQRKEDGQKQFAKLSPIDKFISKVKKRGEKYGLFPFLDNIFYRVAKNAVELLVHSLYDFTVRGKENIPVDQNVGIILLAHSKTTIDLIFGNALIPEKIHFMIDKKTYEQPVLSSILQSLGFFRKTEHPDDFEPLLDLKFKLKEKKLVGIFAKAKGREKLIRTVAGVLKLAIEGKPTVVVPVGIAGTETPFPPVKVHFEIGEPIGPIPRMKRKKRYEYAEEVAQILKNLQDKAFAARYERG
ncbi:MAG: 1-acyl-sn-glycerol-3-phosphate acyltransferase [Candidatus Helarchaeota archaeon]|nr:1-acyl-sn-glycerol-3-phosphate acyltransferase [Candidatus Helarchaeota archaeon]